MEEQDRQRVWPLYGWFCGLMCVGSVFGACAWAAQMQSIILNFLTQKGIDPLHLQWSVLAQQYLWSTGFYIPYAMEFLCLSVAKLMVLDRMAEFALPAAVGKSKIWVVGRRVVTAVIVVGNLTGLVGNILTTVFSKQLADVTNFTAAVLASNNTDAAYLQYLGEQANQKAQVVYDYTSVQPFCEVTVLLIVIAAFAVVGIACARRVNSTLGDLFLINDDRVWAAGRQLRRRIVGTTALVFVTFLLRAVFSIMNALSAAAQNQGVSCPNAPNQCDPCYNMWLHIGLWLQFTPEFQLCVVLVSSPLSLIFALWGMTTERMRKHTSSSKKLKQLSTMRDRMLRGSVPDAQDEGK
jgi:hypothetical protein